MAARYPSARSPISRADPAHQPDRSRAVHDADAPHAPQPVFAVEHEPFRLWRQVVRIGAKTRIGQELSAIAPKMEQFAYHAALVAANVIRALDLAVDYEAACMQELFASDSASDNSSSSHARTSLDFAKPGDPLEQIENSKRGRNADAHSAFETVAISDERPYYERARCYEDADIGSDEPSSSPIDVTR
jgi:hypothetical protein